ncbi:sensor histidine kinase [Streptomyces sp. NPDC058470]|uniref:sensor histidine kinase n=1 Tax=Streptomyces sp. NPDC058470 TaxID=3346515 RepID=UPI0036470B70
MSVTTRLTSRIARPHLPRRTVRLRMTMLYGALFLASGASLLAITYALVRHAVGAPPGKDASDVPPDDADALTPRTDVPARKVATSEELARRTAEIMHELLVQSGFALTFMLVVSIVLGWIVAGRMLDPLKTITATARDISATSLHQRLDLEGPGDELKELGDTFDSLLGRLEASFEAQRRFVANASHELRTPLARQRALGQVVLSDPDATVESLRSAHERILAAGVQQEQLIEGLLTLAKSQGGIDVREPFDLARLTVEVIYSRRAEAQYRTVTFLPSISPALAMGHRNLAERLVTNLLDNALRHNSSHGWVEVATKTESGRATITVTNTGPLVPRDAIDQIFQPFQRLGTVRAARAEGHGLGLSIVEAIAYAHDATITTWPRPEGGLSISVAFPTAHGPAKPPQSHPDQATARSR